jgi:hypothetical protein
MVIAGLFLLAACGDDDDDKGGDGGTNKGDGSSSLEAGGGGEEGFGDYCSDVAHPCKPGFICSRQFGEPLGVCTKKCAVFGDVCTGAPSGTRAECLANILGSDYACVFLCGTAGGKTHTCPPELACKQDMQLTNGFYTCRP